MGASFVVAGGVSAASFFTSGVVYLPHFQPGAVYPSFFYLLCYRWLQDRSPVGGWFIVAIFFIFHFSFP